MWGKDQKTVGTSVQSEVNHNDIQHFFGPPSGSFKKKTPAVDCQTKVKNLLKHFKTLKFQTKGPLTFDPFLLGTVLRLF